METKLCGKCKTVKTVSEFHKRGKGYQPWCIPCKKEYDHIEYKNNPQAQCDRNRNRRHRQRKWFIEYKKKRCCAFCGLNDRWWCLGFHHLDGEDKHDDIANMVRDCSQETILKELEKCVCLCHNCHSDLHYYEERNKVKYTSMMKKIKGV